jgi:hypothetical protein
MHRFLPILILSTLIGCAARPAASTALTPVPMAGYSYPASALCFTPPVAYALPPLDLSRDDRSPAAYAGFQQSTTSYTYTRIDDHQSTDFLNSYDRQTFIEQIGTTVR